MRALDFLLPLPVAVHACDAARAHAGPASQLALPARTRPALARSARATRALIVCAPALN